MDKRIKQHRLWEIMERTDANGAPIVFQIKFVKQNGEIREYPACTLTSMHYSGTSINVLPLGEKFPRSISRITIIEFNNIPVYL